MERNLAFTQSLLESPFFDSMFFSSCVPRKVVFIRTRDIVLSCLAFSFDQRASFRNTFLPRARQFGGLCLQAFPFLVVTINRGLNIGDQIVRPFLCFKKSIQCNLIAVEVFLVMLIKLSDNGEDLSLNEGSQLA